jgi:hypothetical protein
MCSQDIALNSENNRWLSQCDSLLQLQPSQKQNLTQILLQFQSDIARWEKRKQEMATSQLSNDEWEKQDAQLQSERKELRNRKEESIIQSLDENQKQIYYSKISPAKPSVLHMGLKHDRANCTICVKPPSP